MFIVLYVLFAPWFVRIAEIFKSLEYFEGQILKIYR